MASTEQHASGSRRLRAGVSRLRAGVEALAEARRGVWLRPRLQTARRLTAACASPRPAKRRRVGIAVGLALTLCIAGGVLAGCTAGDGQPAGDAASPASVARTATPAATASPTPPDPTATATPSPTTTPTATPTAPPTPTATPTPSPTALPTPDGVAREARVPILMYHHLADPPPGADRYRRDLSVSPTQFAEQLAWLRAEGYQSITLEQLLRHLTLGEPLPERPVIITFDDGYADNYSNAFPLLQEYGFGAVFFVVTELAERASAGLTAPDGTVYADEYMSWEQLREMAAAGMEIQCHARVHEDLTDMDDQRLVWQVLGCREMMESGLGQRPRFVAYPSGIYNQRVADFFASDGYWGGVTTHQGSLQRSDALFDIRRLRIRRGATVEELAELLAWDEEAAGD